MGITRVKVLSTCLLKLPAPCRMGLALGLGDKLKEEDPDRANLTKEGDFNYKAASRYQNAIQRNTTGASEFSKTKSIKE